MLRVILGPGECLGFRAYGDESPVRDVELHMVAGYRRPFPGGRYRHLGKGNSLFNSNREPARTVPGLLMSDFEEVRTGQQGADARVGGIKIGDNLRAFALTRGDLLRGLDLRGAVEGHQHGHFSRGLDRITGPPRYGEPVTGDLALLRDLAIEDRK